MSEATTDTGVRLSPRRKRKLAWVGAAAVIALIVGLIAVFGPDRNAAPQKLSNQPAQVPQKQVSVKLPAEAKAVAQKFIRTAVARKDLGAAWEIAGPNVRGGLTRKEWMTGAIPVIPYPIGHLDKAPFKIDYSYANDALIEVALLPKPGAKIKAQLFFLNLKRVGPPGNKHWVVDNWVPRASAMVPAGENNGA